MNALKATWNFTKTGNFFLESNYYEVLILRNKEVVEQILISLEGNVILSGNNWFQFDKQLLNDLHKTHPFDFHIQDSVFYSKKQAESYADGLKSKTSCLFAFGNFPEVTYEGEFFMTFYKSKKVPDFKVATDVASNKLKKIAQDKEFMAGYALSDFNLKYQDKFQVTVNTSRAIYDKLPSDGFEKGGWKRSEYGVASYWAGKGNDSTITKGKEAISADIHDADKINERFNTGKLEVLARYPGGFEEFTKYIHDAFEYPEAAIAANVSGEMIASFVINEKGQVVDVKIIKGLGYGTEEELIRVLRKSPKWYPGKQNGKNIRVLYTLPVKVHAASYVQTNSIKAPSGRNKFYFENRLNLGLATDFVDEDGRQALSDRFSVLNSAVNSFPKDSLAQISGKISYQVIIDSTGKCSVISFKNETNRPVTEIKIDEILGKSRWNLLPSGKGMRETVSAILVFTFADDHIKYQHLTMDPNSGQPVEIEFAKKSKPRVSW